MNFPNHHGRAWPGHPRLAFGLPSPTSLRPPKRASRRRERSSGFAQAGGGEVEAHLAKLAKRLLDLAGEPDSIARFETFQRGFKYPRDRYRLPESVTAPERYRVKARGVELVKGKEAWALRGSKGTVAVPDEMREMVAWTLARESFSRAELSAAFPGRRPSLVDRLLADLAAMKLTEPV